MKFRKINVHPLRGADPRLRAVANILTADGYAINGIRVYEDKGKMYVRFPIIHSEGNRDAQIVRIKSRSSITVVIAKIMENLPLVGKTITYYISVPNYGIALPEIENLNESAWIVDRLLVRNMPRVDAVTIAQVLRDVLKNEVKQNDNEIQSL